MWVTEANAIAECVIIRIKYRKSGTMVHTFNLRTQVVENDVNLLSSRSAYSKVANCFGRGKS